MVQSVKSRFTFTVLDQSEHIKYPLVSESLSNPWMPRRLPLWLQLYLKNITRCLKKTRLQFADALKHLWAACESLLNSVRSGVNGGRRQIASKSSHLRISLERCPNYTRKRRLASRPTCVASLYISWSAFMHFCRGCARRLQPVTLNIPMR